MNLSEHIKQSVMKPKPKSIVGDWIETLSDEDKQSANAALLDQSISDMALHRAFASYGAEFSKFPLVNYRRRVQG